MLASIVALLAPPRCLACNAPVPAGTHLCGGCRRELVWLAPDPTAPAWAPVAFDGPARALVHALKFSGRTAAAQVMAAQIHANAPANLLTGTLVPVPAHPRRKRDRGFDQARLIATHLARRARLLLADPLSRHLDSGEQVGASRTHRLTSDLGITARRPPEGRIVLVDDVVTTGATLAACARALREAGAADVVAVTYARTLG